MPFLGVEMELGPAAHSQFRGATAQEEGDRYDDRLSGLVTGTRRIRLVACSRMVASLGETAALVERLLGAECPYLERACR
jgi:hypothetical protein